MSAQYTPVQARTASTQRRYHGPPPQGAREKSCRPTLCSVIQCPRNHVGTQVVGYDMTSRATSSP